MASKEREREGDKTILDITMGVAHQRATLHKQITSISVVLKFHWMGWQLRKKMSKKGSLG